VPTINAIKAAPDKIAPRPQRLDLTALSVSIMQIAPLRYMTTNPPPRFLRKGVVRLRKTAERARLWKYVELRIASFLVYGEDWDRKRVI
jgi:hypothetical protein